MAVVGGGEVFADVGCFLGDYFAQVAVDELAGADEVWGAEACFGLATCKLVSSLVCVGVRERTESAVPGMKYLKAHRSTPLHDIIPTFTLAAAARATFKDHGCPFQKIRGQD